MEPPIDPILTPWGEGTLPLMHPKEDKPFDFGRMRQREGRPQRCSRIESCALLIGSDKMYGLLNMTTLSREYQAAVHAGGLSGARGLLAGLWQLQAAGPVQMEVNIQGALGGKTRRGCTTPWRRFADGEAGRGGDLGAHLDSWDLGTGATDNGTGSHGGAGSGAGLQKLGVKPKRTIRFVLVHRRGAGLERLAGVCGSAQG